MKFIIVSWHNDAELPKQVPGVEIEIINNRPEYTVAITDMAEFIQKWNRPVMFKPLYLNDGTTEWLLCITQYTSFGQR